MSITLKVEKREEKGRGTDALRAENLVPAVVYGLDKEPVSITVGRSDFDRIYKEAGESTVVSLDLDGSTEQVLIHDIQHDPLTGFTTHADFLRVDMKKKVETAISLILVGEAPVVKSEGASLTHAVEEINVRALPNDLVKEIEVDVSGITTLDDVIHVSDLTIPASIEVLDEGDLTVVTVQPPRSEEEMEDLDAPVEEGDVNAVEVAADAESEEESGEEESAE